MEHTPSIRTAPWPVKQIQMNLLIVANDLGAVDFACYKLMGIDPFKISHFKAAQMAGMFPSSVEDVVLNNDLRQFIGKKFCLERNFLNRVALLAFNSRLLTKLFYD